MTCSALTNEELLASLKKLVVREREVIADVVEHLAEVDIRKLYIPAACSSLTAYCVERLGYGQEQAARRVTAARLVRVYPMILPMLRSGDLNLSTLRTIAPVLTASNHRERLEAAVGRTRNELERMVAGWAPKPDLPTRIVPVKTDEPPVLLACMQAASVASEPAPLVATPAPPSRPAPLPKPLTPERYSIQLTVDRETYEDLMRVRDHLRHAIPDGDVAKIFARAVKELRAKVEARKFGKRKTEKPTGDEPRTEKPRTKKPTTEKPTTDHRVPKPDGAPIIDEGIAMPRTPTQATRREVADRDDYQCCFVSDDGRRCSSTAWLEFDHKLEWSRHGPTWPENMQLLCRAHNQAKQRGSTPPRAAHEAASAVYEWAIIR